MYRFSRRAAVFPKDCINVGPSTNFFINYAKFSVHLPWAKFPSDKTPKSTDPPKPVPAPAVMAKQTMVQWIYSKIWQTKHQSWVQQ